jgi:hypothetical protein
MKCFDNPLGRYSLVRAVLAQAILEVTAARYTSRPALNEAILSARWLLSPDKEAADRFTFHECCVLLDIEPETAKECVANAVQEAGRDLHRLAAKPIRAMSRRKIAPQSTVSTDPASESSRDRAES